MTSWVNQLADIHKKLGTGRGRRHNQEALYRAGVVMTVAAWESFVEDLLIESFKALQPDANASVGERSTWAIANNAAKAATKKFNTPNAKNVIDLFEEHLDISVLTAWSVKTKLDQFTAEQSKTRINSWLDIRHKIAHGGSLPSNIQWIKGPKNNPRLTLALMNEVNEFFSKLAASMDDYVAEELKARYGLAAKPW